MSNGGCYVRSRTRASRRTRRKLPGSETRYRLPLRILHNRCRLQEGCKFPHNATDNRSTCYVCSSTERQAPSEDSVPEAFQRQLNDLKQKQQQQQRQ